MFRKAIVLFLVLCFYTPLISAYIPATSLEDAITNSDPEIVSSLSFQIKYFDNGKRERLLKLAQNVIILRRNAVAALYIACRDLDSFSSYWMNHKTTKTLLPQAFTATILGICGLLFHTPLRLKSARFDRFASEYPFNKYGDWLLAVLSIIGYYTISSLENHIMPKFLQKRLDDALAINDMISRTQTQNTSVAGTAA